MSTATRSGGQIVHGKLMQIRLSGRIKGLGKLPESARAERLERERRTWLDELRQAAFVEARL